MGLAVVGLEVGLGLGLGLGLALGFCRVQAFEVRYLLQCRSVRSGSGCSGLHALQLRLSVIRVRVGVRTSQGQG